MTSPQSQPLLHFLEGNKQSKNLIVFLQGWPDNHVMWDWMNWKEDLSQYAILFIDFPNTSTDKADLKWGQDFPVIIQRLKTTLQKFNKYQVKHLVAHDWGCVYGYMFDKKYPRYFKQIIALDVPAYVQLKSISQVLMVVTYQLYLVIAFLIGGPIGKTMTQAFAKFSKHNPPYFEQINGNRNYPYYYYWKNKIKGLISKQNLFLYGYKPSVPVVYLYGKNKPFQFHGQKWMKLLNEDPNCEVHSFDAGHWFMKKFDKFIIELINRRVLAKL